MVEVRIVFHHEGRAFWADSPDVPGWTASLESLEGLGELIREGVSIALDTDPAELVIRHSVKVLIHCEEGSWWAESPDVPFFAGGCASEAEIRELAREALAFTFEVDPSEIEMIETVGT